MEEKLIKKLVKSLRKTAEALNEYRAVSSQNFNPSDIDQICDEAQNVLDEIDFAPQKENKK